MDGLKATLSFDAFAYDYDDEYLTIDTDTHTININNVSRLFGVQYDGNSKLIKFRIRNKLSDIQKMQDSIVYINWIDSRGVKGQSIAINKTINNDTCEFAWKVPFDALKNSGVLHFAMSAVVTKNSSSVIDQRWSTQIASVITPDGIYIKSYTPSSEEEDRIAQIYNELSNMINKQNDNLQSQVNSLNEGVNNGNVYNLDNNIGNIYQFAQDFKDKYYSYNNAGVIGYEYSETFTCFLLQIKSNTKYYTNNDCRFITLLDSSKTPIDKTNLESVRQFDSKNAKYASITIKLDVKNDFAISTNPTDVDEIIISPPFLISENNIYATKKIEPHKYFDKFSGDYTEEIKLENVKSSVSSSVVYSASMNIQNITDDMEVHIKLKSFNNDVIAEDFCVTKEKIIITDYYYGTYYRNEHDHGLTLINNLELIITQENTSNFKVKLSSNGYEYQTATVQLAKQFVTIPILSCSNVKLTDVSFSWISRKIDKDIWCFGDSYFGSLDTNRWVYYLDRDGYYDSHLFDNYGGESSYFSIESLKSLLNINEPKTIFWALGMNDGTDTNETPNAYWKTYIDELISICNTHNIQLILATIPSVPTINHEGKNKWVRESGYQYVDFAKAVGANSSGEWFTGMLSSDSVHPSVQGALSLYNRVISDFPQITLSD